MIIFFVAGTYDPQALSLQLTQCSEGSGTIDIVLTAKFMGDVSK